MLEKGVYLLFLREKASHVVNLKYKFVNNEMIS